MAQTRKSIGVRIRQHRIKLRLTQEELARQWGTSPTAISFIETGFRPLGVRMAIVIKKSWGWDLDELLDDSEVEP